MKFHKTLLMKDDSTTKGPSTSLERMANVRGRSFLVFSTCAQRNYPLCGISRKWEPYVCAMRISTEIVHLNSGWMVDKKLHMDKCV